MVCGVRARGGSALAVDSSRINMAIKGFEIQIRVRRECLYAKAKKSRRTWYSQRVAMSTTNDKIIRAALIADLKQLHTGGEKLRIVEEFCVEHGAIRIDIAVVNGLMHGYEIKSDRDTLLRLPEQMHAYNAVFDRVTLVVGKQHLYAAINIVPDWWGLTIAKLDNSGSVVLNRVREAEENTSRSSVAIARLLWRAEALQLLQNIGEAAGLRFKPRELIYERLAERLDQKSLGDKVRDALFFREDWRSDAPLVLNGG